MSRTITKKRLGRHIVKHGVYYIFFLSGFRSIKSNITLKALFFCWMIHYKQEPYLILYLFMRLTPRKKNDKFLVAVQPLQKTMGLINYIQDTHLQTIQSHLST